MAAETRSGNPKVTFTCAKSLREKFARKCKKNNTSQSQVLRDKMQAYVKAN